MGARPMVVALYDYDAQQAGDLSFRKDDRIEIIERTANADDWWTGKLNGQQGVFPGKIFFFFFVFCRGYLKPNIFLICPSLLGNYVQEI